MTQAKAEPKLYSFDEFISWYPDSSEVRYELHDGVIIGNAQAQGETFKSNRFPDGATSQLSNPNGKDRVMNQTSSF